MRSLATIALAAALAMMGTSCRPGGTPEVGDGSGSGEGSSVAIDEGSGAQPVAVDSMRALVASEQPCSADADCRVWQPSDWSADVECCYDYPCTLDYVALNRSNWETLRAWQRANPFDCTAHLREEGPCNNRPQRCGLSQEPPAAVCRDGECAVATPEAWPVPDPDAQTCSTASDCTAIRPSSASLRARCCRLDCVQDWVPVNRSTADEFVAHLAANAPDCVTYLGDTACPVSAACSIQTPQTRCDAGLCRLNQP